MFSKIKIEALEIWDELNPNFQKKLNELFDQL